MKSALDVHRVLLADDVPHEMVRLRAGVLGADDLPRVLGVPPQACVAVRCYRTASCDGVVGLCAVLVRAGDIPDPSSLLTALDAASVRPATSAEVNDATGYAAVLVSPIALPDDVVLLADAALGATSAMSEGSDISDVLYAPTGESGVALGIRLRDLLVASRARVTNLTARPLADEERLGWQGSSGGALVQTADVRVLALRQRRAGRRRIG